MINDTLILLIAHMHILTGEMPSLEQAVNYRSIVYVITPVVERHPLQSWWQSKSCNYLAGKETEQLSTYVIRTFIELLNPCV